MLINSDGADICELGDNLDNIEKSCMLWPTEFELGIRQLKLCIMLQLKFWSVSIMQTIRFKEPALKHFALSSYPCRPHMSTLGRQSIPSPFPAISRLNESEHLCPHYAFYVMPKIFPTSSPAIKTTSGKFQQTLQSFS